MKGFLRCTGTFLPGNGGFWGAFFNVDDMAEEENINFDDGIKPFYSAVNGDG
ncbi:hypothetical protein [Neisseria uirgultaei]|uniref:hypothetical protein n=1 Tax=Neisseria uirgultaei TaxID=2830646 RepID=UPI002659CD6F|nr:hypothetical protein [Neisseria uirgultaei]